MGVEAGVPKVITDDTKHQRKFPFYPYYLSPEYKMYFHRFITEAAIHIRSFPVETQKRIAFIQVMNGCSGDEVPYKGKPKEAKYDITKESPEWSAFRIETFALYAKLFDRTEPKITLLFSGVTGDTEGEDDGKSGDEGKHEKEWKWVTANITGV